MAIVSGKPRYYYPLPERPPPPPVDCDVCVYGATSAGVSAAVQAASLGKKVALVEFGNHIGGMTTSGLSATDIGDRHVIGGLARRFYRDVGQKCGLDEAWLFEPHVALAVYEEWIEKHSVGLYLEQRLASVKKSHGRIVSMETEGGGSYRAAVYIDATYEGDLMAVSGVSFAVGREKDSVYTELFNGIQYGRQHDFLRFVDPYRKPGDPSSGLIVGVSDMALGTQGDGDGLVQAYNFRLCLTKEKGNRVPFAKPSDYDPERYELLRRYIDARVFDVFNLNRPIPGRKTDFNNWGAAGSDNIGASHGWPEGNYKERERIYQDHVSYTQGLLYFLANDRHLPQLVRSIAGAWGLAADEFTDTGNWPPQPLRQGGAEDVLRLHHDGADSFGRNYAGDSVGMASYRMDSHNCKRVVYAGRVVNEGDVEVTPLDPTHPDIVPCDQAEARRVHEPARTRLRLLLAHSVRLHADGARLHDARTVRGRSRRPRHREGGRGRPGHLVQRP